MIIVTAHFTKNGPIGVPNGFVDAQNLGNGNTPCLRSRQFCMHHSGRHGHSPSAFSNDTRLSNLHSNQITKRAQSDEQVEEFYAFGMAQDIGEEETRDRHTRRPDVVFRY
jgi:hypothetical protein